jgi:hypothetical protein
MLKAVVQLVPGIPLILLSVRTIKAKGEDFSDEYRMFALTVYGAMLIGIFVYRAFLRGMLRKRRQRVLELEHTVQECR